MLYEVHKLVGVLAVLIALPPMRPLDSDERNNADVGFIVRFCVKSPTRIANGNEADDRSRFAALTQQPNLSPVSGHVRNHARFSARRYLLDPIGDFGLPDEFRTAIEILDMWQQGGREWRFEKQGTSP
jgi:hypothetical protein